MTRKLKFTDAELKTVIIDANLALLRAIKAEIDNATDDPDTPASARQEFKFTTELLGNNIEAITAIKENS